MNQCVTLIITKSYTDDNDNENNNNNNNNDNKCGNINDNMIVIK